MNLQTLTALAEYHRDHNVEGLTQNMAKVMLNLIEEIVKERAKFIELHYSGWGHDFAPEVEDHWCFEKAREATWVPKDGAYLMQARYELNMLGPVTDTPSAFGGSEICTHINGPHGAHRWIVEMLNARMRIQCPGVQR